MRFVLHALLRIAYFKCSINKQTLNNENNVKISIALVCVHTIWMLIRAFRRYFFVNVLFVIYCYTFASDYFCLTYIDKYICMIIGFLTCRLKATFIECYSKNKQLHFKRREYLVIQNETINQEKILKTHIL